MLDLLPLRRFRVADTSMQPTLRPGDRIVVATWFSPRVGDVVVVRDPEWPTTWTVKRVVALTDEGLDVRGDNVNVSRDSRHFGLVPPGLVIGRVVFRSLPGRARRRL
jgi:nickel-type superoxide dismutase maturation protease